MELKKSGNIKVKSPHHSRDILIDFQHLVTHQPKPVILFVHGFKGFKDWGPFNLMADYFAQAGFVFVKMNFSHNGTTVDQPTDFADLEAFGQNNFSIEQQDITTVLDYLVHNLDESECDLQKINLIGHSRGGGAAILAAHRHDCVKRLATLAALNNLDSRYPEAVMTAWEKNGVFHVYNARTEQQMPLYYQIVEDYFSNSNQLDISQAVKNLEKPFMAFHGTGDETLPVTMLHEMKSWNPDLTAIEMPGVNHTFGGQHPHNEDSLPKDLKIAIDHIIDFFK